LLEILLVVGIIAILAGIVIIAINPSKQLATVRNTERKSDIKQIESAITQYYIDNSRYPTSLTGNLTEICDTGANASSSGQTTTCTNASLINLSELVPVYLTAIPKDPSATTTNRAGYQIVLTNNKIGLSAPAELGQTITIGTVPTVAAGCGDPTNTDCWSPVASGLGWGPRDTTSGVVSPTAGAANTATLAGLAGSYPAADYCDALTYDGHTDWYLPAKQQLIDGLTNQFVTPGGTVIGFADGTFYWSSTENSFNPDVNAWSAGYLYGTVNSYLSDKDDTYSQSRCLR
jgi:type II secretory pathway pseudopilin PulG